MMENIIEQENLVNQDVTFPVAYACYNKDLQTRLDSTSGGAFTTLATYFLKENDAVIFEPHLIGTVMSSILEWILWTIWVDFAVQNILKAMCVTAS